MVYLRALRFCGFGKVARKEQWQGKTSKGKKRREGKDEHQRPSRAQVLYSGNTRYRIPGRPKQKQQNPTKQPRGSTWPDKLSVVPWLHMLNCRGETFVFVFLLPFIVSFHPFPCFHSSMLNAFAGI